jgi:calnexin
MTPILMHCIYRIEDGEEKRPEDWGEEAEAEFIPDPTAKQPAGWLADEPPTVPHPDFDFVPADWDEREDGPYHPPEIRISPPY